MLLDDSTYYMSLSKYSVCNISGHHRYTAKRWLLLFKLCSVTTHKLPPLNIMMLQCTVTISTHFIQLHTFSVFPRLNDGTEYVGCPQTLGTPYTF